VLRMSPARFYAANISSALLWAPLHIFPGVLAALLLRILGVGREQLTLTIIVGVLVLAAGSGFMYGWICKRPPPRLLPLRFIEMAARKSRQRNSDPRG
jgi:membrane protein DedA with SNARE-associated domain